MERREALFVDRTFWVRCALNRRTHAPRGAPSRCLTTHGPRFWRLIHLSTGSAHHQQAPCGRSYCLRAEPRRRPSAWGAFPQTRGHRALLHQI